MISEVDIRDWYKIDLSPLVSATDALHDEHYPNTSAAVWKVYQQLCDLRAKQIKAITKQIPAVFKPIPGGTE